VTVSRGPEPGGKLLVADIGGTNARFALRSMLFSMRRAGRRLPGLPPAPPGPWQAWALQRTSQ
jgi:hypothetical protein